MDKFANIQAFAAVGETGNFVKAAKKLNIANSVVSKRIKDLEHFLGTQLLIRTTRKVVLTGTGQIYLDYVHKFLEELNEVENTLRYQTDKPAGTIKLAAPLSFGMRYLGGAIGSYLHQYPNVTIKTYLSDRYVDLMEEGYDIAIRSGTLSDSTLIAKKLLSCRRVVCASPHYLRQYGIPKSPEELKDHNCLGYLNLAEGKSWPFYVNGKKIWQSINGNFFSDNGDLLHEAALSGCGIVMLPTFIIDQSIREKKLELILEDFEEKDFSVYAVYQYTRHLPVKIRTLIDHFAMHFKEGLV